MILPDINLLIYAHNAAAPHHVASKQWWTDCLNEVEPVALPWIVSSGFIRLSTHPRVLESPLSPAVAVEYVENWLDRPMIHTRLS